MITCAAPCLRQLPSCVAVYPRDSHRDVFYVARVPAAPFQNSKTILFKNLGPGSLTRYELQHHNNPRRHRDPLCPAHIHHRRAARAGRSHPARAGDYFRWTRIPPGLDKKCWLGISSKPAQRILLFYVSLVPIAVVMMTVVAVINPVPTRPVVRGTRVIAIGRI